MKVLHFISSIDRNLGGTTAYLQLLANELGKSIEIMVVAGDHRHDPIEIDNATVKLIDIKMASSLNVLGLYNKRQKIKRQINDISLPADNVQRSKRTPESYRKPWILPLLHGYLA